MMNSPRQYSIGWKKPQEFHCEQNTICYLTPVTKRKSIVIICNLKEKSFSIEKNGQQKSYIDKKKLIYGINIDLSDNGERWEGTAYDGEPFGYGCYYDENNRLLYSGFVFKGQKICYGEEFYPDSNTVEYCGNYVNGLRHGWGCQYDKEGNLLFEGEWAFGRCGEFRIRIGDNCNDDNMIHNLVKELKIGNHCYTNLKELVIKQYKNLKSIEIGDNSFKNVRLFEIAECNELESVKIGKNSFVIYVRFRKFYRSDGEFIIHDCSKLTSIQTGCHSFFDYTNSFQLYGIG